MSVGCRDSHTVVVSIVLHEDFFRRERRSAFPTFKVFSHNISPPLIKLLTFPLDFSLLLHLVYGVERQLGRHHCGGTGHDNGSVTYFDNLRF